MMAGALELRRRLAVLEEQIGSAAARINRPPLAVQLVVASKQQPAALMQVIIDELNQRGRQPVFGESYVQEFKGKKPLLQGAFGSHLIGTLQGNKAKTAVALFDLVESVHSRSIAAALNTEAAKQGRELPIFLQINVSADSHKSGFLPAEAAALVKEDLPGWEHLRLRGLMTITRYYAEAELVRPDFRALRELRDELVANCDWPGREARQPLLLSMGMSADFAIAIEEGADLVRVGTALFGERG